MEPIEELLAKICDLSRVIAEKTQQAESAWLLIPDPEVAAKVCLLLNGWTEVTPDGDVVLTHTGVLGFLELPEFDTEADVRAWWSSVTTEASR